MVDTLNTHQEAKPEDPQYVEEMVAKAEGLNNVQEERPSWLPDKFQSAEQMAEAYAQLENRFHSGDEYEYEDSEVDDMETGEVSEYLANNGIDFDDMSESFWEDGGLSDDHYDALEQIGIPAEIVDQFIDGQLAMVDQTRSTAFDAVGGEDYYNEMTQWAAANLDESEISAFNGQIDSGNMDTAMFAIQGLAARYRSETGVEPNLVGGEASDVSVGAFQSLAEITSAMSDPRYEKDPAYRDQVARKLSRSSVF